MVKELAAGNELLEHFPSFGNNLLSGFIAGSCGIYTGHPLDTVKVRMQLSKTGISATESIKHIIAKDGFSGFFKGVVSPVLGTAPMVAVLFSVNDLSKKTMEHWDHSHHLKDFLSGAMAGTCVSFLITPVDLLKIRKQAKGNQSLTYPQIIKQVYNYSGAKGIYQGFTPCLLRSCFPNGMFFYVNSNTQRLLNVDKDKNTHFSLAWKKILAGGLAGQAFWFSGYPFDVIKSHMQYKPKHSNFLETIKHIYKRHGIKYFYRGCTITLLRAFPVNAINFITYELVSNHLNYL